MRQRGYTLLEILVVVAVIAIRSGALVLSASGAGSERQVEDEARRLALVLQLRRARAVASMVATIVFTVIITAGLLLLHQGQLTIFNLVALLLVVGVVSNYTLFFSTLSPEPDARQRESLSVLLAAASTLIGFSTLAFSSTPVLAMIGQTVAIGAAVGLGVSMVFSADRADLNDPGADPG